MKQVQQDISMAGEVLRIRNFRQFPIDALPSEARQAEVLDFSHNQFADLPDSLGEMFPCARVIFLSDTKMHALPRALAGCSGLEMVGARGSGIEQLDIGALPKSLKVLTLTDNNIGEIPASIAQLTQLEKLIVSGNALKELPVELVQCRNLEMLRISSNRIVVEPRIPAELPRLAWYVDAGNPFSVQRQPSEFIEIDANRLSLGDEVGKSANNRVYAARLDDVSEVAVKLYGADLSADGAVVDEIAALQAAQAIEGVVSALGVSRIDGKIAVVMPLVGSEYRQLAAPPDLRHYLRDRYGEQVFTADEATMLLDKVRRAVEKLHANGIAHGDIYAHNLLYSGDDVLLNDFGAASLYSPEAGSFRRMADERALKIFEEEIRTRAE